MTFVEWVMIGLGTLVYAYVLVRIMSFAYFRTKREHMRRSVRDFEGSSTEQ